MLGYATEKTNVFRAILGVSWFWFLGSVFLTQIPAFSRDVLGAAEPVTNLFIATFTIGIAGGSMLTNKLLKGEVSAKYVPIAAILTTLAIIDLWWASSSVTAPAGGELLSGCSLFRQRHQLAHPHRSGADRCLRRALRRCRYTLTSSCIPPTSTARGLLPRTTSSTPPS